MIVQLQIQHVPVNISLLKPTEKVGGAFRPPGGVSDSAGGFIDQVKEIGHRQNAQPKKN